MATLKHSRQRESIKTFLMTRKDHPTADTVYLHVQKEFPKISLGTVYRNLSLLVDIGEIQRIKSEDGADRFDGNPKKHYHFYCRNCHGVSDLEMDSIDHITLIAGQHFEGIVEDYDIMFTGLCPECSRQENKQ